MNDLLEAMSIILFICVMAIISITFMSLPFAFLGWIVLTVISIFTTLSITYIGSFATGLVTAIIISLFSK